MNAAVHPLGDSALTIVLAEEPGTDATKLSRVTAELLRRSGIPHIGEVVASYTSVTVFYDSLHASFDQMETEILETIESASLTGTPAIEGRHHRIAVRYDGPDLDSVAAATGLDREKVVEIHSSRTYDVDLLGFVPGFAYLSALDPRLELPRREHPRPRVPAGSVAIAARMTGIYPFATPGGWHILGSSVEVMFDPRRPDPSLFRPGDTVKFEPLP